MDSEQQQASVKYALERAAEYIRANRFEVDAKIYDTPAVRRAVGKIVAEATDRHEPVMGTRRVTYLAGANGSKHLLMDAVESKAKSEFLQEIRDAVTLSVRSDFASHKSKFAALTGEKVNENYNQWRPLMSGIDQAIALHARETKRHFMYDKKLSPDDEKDRARMLSELAAEKPGSRLQMFAVALTPDEAKAEASRRRIGPEEAPLSAKHFAEFFPELCKQMPNVTLVDAQMNVIYRQKDGKTVQRDEAKLEAWKKVCAEYRPAPPQKTGMKALEEVVTGTLFSSFVRPQGRGWGRG